MSTGYKALNRHESYCSLNSSGSSHEDISSDPAVVSPTSTTPPDARPLIKKKSVYVFRCRYCKETFTSREDGVERQCDKAPNYARDNVESLCIVRGYRGCWYHMTKDDEESDDVNILRLDFPPNMEISLWVKYILISIFCFPCICLWLPFALWERQTRFVFGPRHSIRRKRKPAEPRNSTQSQRTSASQPPKKETQSDPEVDPPSESKLETPRKQEILIAVPEESDVFEEEGAQDAQISSNSVNEIQITLESTEVDTETTQLPEEGESQSSTCLPGHREIQVEHDEPPSLPDHPPPEDEDESKLDVQANYSGNGDDPEEAIEDEVIERAGDVVMNIGSDIMAIHVVEEDDTTV